MLPSCKLILHRWTDTELLCLAISLSPNPASLTTTDILLQKCSWNTKIQVKKKVVSLFGTFLELWFNANSKVLITNLNNLPSWCCKRKQLGNGSLRDHSKTTQTSRGLKIWKFMSFTSLNLFWSLTYAHIFFFTSSNRSLIIFYIILNWAWWHQATDACRLFFLSSTFTARLLQSPHTVKKKWSSRILSH